MKTLFAAGAMLVISTAASAAPVCASGSLTSFISLSSAGCMIGTNLVSGFTNFAGSVPSPYVTGATRISADLITVTPNNSSTAPMLTFFTNTTATNTLDEALIGYRISGNLYTMDTITLSGTSSGGNGGVTDIQNYCLGGTFAGSGPTSGCTGVAGTLLVLGNGSNSATFGAVSSIAVVHDFTLDGAGGAAGAGSATGGTISDTYAARVQASGVPEPASLVLLASGLALGAFAKRFTRKGGNA